VFVGWLQKEPEMLMLLMQDMEYAQGLVTQEQPVMLVQPL